MEDLIFAALVMVLVIALSVCAVVGGVWIGEAL